MPKPPPAMKKWSTLEFEFTSKLEQCEQQCMTEKRPIPSIFFVIPMLPPWHQQLGGVLMGRFVAAMYICSTLSDFKQSVYWVLRRAVERKYSYRLCRSVWSKFLFQRWEAQDIRAPELREWFAKAWDAAERQNKKQNSKTGIWSLPHRLPLEAYMDLFGASVEKVQKQQRPRPPHTFVPRSSEAARSVDLDDVVII